MPKKYKPSPITTGPAIPILVKVQEDDGYRPLPVTFEGDTLDVVFIDERWEEEAEWWKPEPVVEMHYQVSLGDGRQLTVFRNVVTGGWYCVRLPDL